MESFKNFFSPSGCTFWGKKPWSRKKKILWQLGLLVGAPLGVGLVAGIAVPVITFGLPLWAGRKVSSFLKLLNLINRTCAVINIESVFYVVCFIVLADL